jgi:hypothetical protein
MAYVAQLKRDFMNNSGGILPLYKWHPYHNFITAKRIAGR